MKLFAVTLNWDEVRAEFCATGGQHRLAGRSGVSAAWTISHTQTSIYTPKFTALRYSVEMRQTRGSTD